MVWDFDKGKLRPAGIVPPEGAELVMGLYVIGDIIEDSQLDSGIFLKGYEDSDYYFHSLDLDSNGQPVIDQLDKLRATLLARPMCVWYDDLPVIIQQPGSSVAARYDIMCPDAVAPLEAIITRG